MSLLLLFNLPFLIARGSINGIRTALIVLAISLFLYNNYSHFLLGVIDRLFYKEDGSSRVDTWSNSLMSINSPLEFLFGSGSSSPMGHNVAIDILARVGFVGLSAFAVACYFAFKSLAYQYVDLSAGALKSPAFLLFCSVLFSGNAFNTAIMQPWCIAAYLMFYSCFYHCYMRPTRVITSFSHKLSTKAYPMINN
jgi:hypothetical protein